MVADAARAGLQHGGRAGWRPALTLVAGHRSGAVDRSAVPIIGSDRVLGMLSMSRTTSASTRSANPKCACSRPWLASMGVALENARLFEEIQRRTRESAALAEVGRDISSTLDLPTVMDRIAHHAKELLAADHSAIFLPEGAAEGGAAVLPRHRRGRRGRRAGEGHGDRAGVGIIGSIIASGRAEFVNDADHDPRAVQIAGTAQESDERLMVAPLRAGKTVKGAMAVWRTGRQAVPGQRARVPGGPVACRRGGDGERAALRRSAAARGRARHGQHGVAAARRQARPVGADRARRRADPGAVQARHRVCGAARPRHRHDPLPLPARRRQRDRGGAARG